MADVSTSRLFNVGAVLRRPNLWWIALVVLARFAPRQWWRHWPPNPAPDPDYLKFRLATINGEEETGGVNPHELVAYLKWVKIHRRYERAR
jgi:hypothetical protein